MNALQCRQLVDELDGRVQRELFVLWSSLRTDLQSRWSLTVLLALPRRLSRSTQNRFVDGCLLEISVYLLRHLDRLERGV